MLNLYTMAHIFLFDQNSAFFSVVKTENPPVCRDFKIRLLALEIIVNNNSQTSAQMTLKISFVSFFRE